MGRIPREGILSFMAQKEEPEQQLLIPHPPKKINPHVLFKTTPKNPGFTSWGCFQPRYRGIDLHLYFFFFFDPDVSNFPSSAQREVSSSG